MKSLEKHSGVIEGSVDLPISKSMANRALVLIKQFPELSISSHSTSADVKALEQVLSGNGTLDCGAGGTTLRFAMAYWAAQPGSTVTLAGTEKLMGRPVLPLIEALEELGARIQPQGSNGTGPYKVSGAALQGGRLDLGNVESSQYITALLLIAPAMKKGLTLQWNSLPSKPYVLMTVAMLRTAGFDVEMTSNTIVVQPGTPAKTTLEMEPDWSAVAFWCSAVALSTSAKIQLGGFVDPSVQGDSKVVHLFEPLGVKHTFVPGGMLLEKRPFLCPGIYKANLKNTPDLAQPLINTLCALRIPFEVRGLDTLMGKETDRYHWLIQTWKSLGVNLTVLPNGLECEKFPASFVAPSAPFDSYEDHRVAMSLAPLSMLFPIEISAPEVVSKSYPEFWDHWNVVSKA